MSSELLDKLKAPFPESEVYWRAQNLTRNGDKALALAYIDARRVMDRLDSVVGAENWMDSFEVVGPRTICTLSIQVNGNWISKSDGAGDTDYEAEKGSISDAFKRAAVKWGIGRYLYSLDAVWVPCETYEKNGKKVFSKFKEGVNPWDYVRNKPKQLDAKKQTFSVTIGAKEKIAPTLIGAIENIGIAMKGVEDCDAKMRLIQQNQDIVDMALKSSDPKLVAYADALYKRAAQEVGNA